MPEAFATVREAANRVHRPAPLRRPDHGRRRAAPRQHRRDEDRRGQDPGRDAAVLPQRAAGKGVHVVTVNDYLAKYHAEWMGRIHHFLGLTTGVILPQMRPTERRVAYNCDITYGTNNELGFDYLRDNMAGSIEECVQRGHTFAVVDEVDSILIDEARTPLIISGPTQDEVKWYGEFAKIAKTLAHRRRLRGRREEAHHLGPRGRHHQGRGPPRHREPLRVGQHPADLVPQQLDQGQGAVPQRQGVRRHQRRGPHRRRAHRPHARRTPLQRRPAPGDRGQGGREVREEYQTLATITLQNYFRLYEKLSGMTGTAMTEAWSSTRSTGSASSRSRPTSR